MGPRGIFRGMEFNTQRTLHPDTNKKSKGVGGQKTFKVFTLKVFLREEGVGISGRSIKNSKIIVLF